MSHFSDQSVITLNMFYINFSHHPNTLVIISVPVDTASLFSVIPSEFMRKNFINRMLFNDDIY